MRRALPFLLILVSLGLGACSLAGDITPPPGLEAIPSGPTAPAPSLTAPRQPPDLNAGATLFAERCAPCHGPTGRGDGAQASALPVPPAALADPSIARGVIPDEWYSLVTVGRLDRFMPGFTSLTDDDRWSVVGYALSLSLEPELVAQGRDVFAGTCAECHGEDGRGGATGSDLIEPGLQAERSLQSLFGTVTQGVEPGMPGFESALSEDERWAVVSYVRSLGLQLAAVHSLANATAAPPSDTPSVPETPSTPETAAPSQAAATEQAVIGLIEGTILNATPGGRAPGGLDVTLHALDGEAEVLTDTKRANGAGRYAFEVPDLIPGRLYVVTVEYLGQTYASEILHLTTEAPMASLPVRVYETTADTSAVEVDRLHVLASLPGEGIVQIVELWILSNTGDRTIVPSEGGDGLRGTLPEGVAQLSFDEPTAGERYRVEGESFMDGRGLPPGSGTGEWVFSYVLPYERRLDLRRTTQYPIRSVILLVPEGMSVASDGLVDTGSREVQSESLHTYSLGPIAAQQEIDLRLSGRPRSATGTTPVSEWILGAAVLGIALVVAGLLWFRPRRASRAVDGETDSGDLLLSLAALDRDFEAGRIPEDDYRRRREILKRRAMEVLRRTHD